MSFILDALKKSENERQQQATTEFAAIPSAAAAPRAPRWIWVLIGLLVINIGIVAVAMLRTDAEPAVTVAEPPAASETPARRAPSPVAAADEASFAERISTADVPRPEPRRQAEPEPARPAPQEAPRAAATGPQPVVDATSSLALPTLNEVRLDGNVGLPDLHLDIHVYSAVPADRFVFINMQKHQEGSVLDAGPRVDEITPDGVILDYRGTRFVLPRE